jgi:hypothetical protein
VVEEEAVVTDPTIHDHDERWDKRDFDALRSLREAGLTYRGIASRLGRTSRAIASALHRLKKAGREMPKGKRPS